MTAKLTRFLGLAGVLGSAVALAGCGEMVRDGRSPARLLIKNLTIDGATQGQTLRSDVRALVTSGGTCTELNPCYSVFNDIAQVAALGSQRVRVAYGTFLIRRAFDDTRLFQARQPVSGQLGPFGWRPVRPGFSVIVTLFATSVVERG